jgi:hypothetical protein
MNTLKKVVDQFKEVQIESDLSVLTDDIRKALPHLCNAIDMITRIFLRQQHENLPEHYDEVMESGDEEKIRFYELFKGPYNQLTDFKSEFEGINDRRKGCAFYPEKLEDSRILEKIEQLNEEEKKLAWDHYTVIRGDEEGLEIIPYHIHYAEELAEVFDELEEAAGIIEHEELSSYLINRAEALVSGSYRDSDSQWVQLTDTPLDLVIGPFEVYADALLGIKATYESMLMIVDREKGEALKEIENNLENLALHFPMPASSKGAVGGMAPIIVVNQIYAGGEAGQGIMAAAFNLPNDAWVRGNVGWKQVMLYNVMKAKFPVVTAEIACKILQGGDRVAFDPFFTFVLLHEISHGLGPAYRKDGSEVAKCLGSSYVAIEEAKADTGALYLILKLGGQFGIEKYDDEVLLKTYLAGLFRAMRFGLHEAHGMSNLIQFNWLKEKGIISVSGDKFSITLDNLLETAHELLEKICYLEAAATEAEAGDFISRYGKPGGDVLKALESLKDIPIDIKAVYPDLV